jgi:hypothetical protein
MDALRGEIGELALREEINVGFARESPECGQKTNKVAQRAGKHRADTRPSGIAASGTGRFH